MFRYSLFITVFVMLLSCTKDKKDSQDNIIYGKVRHTINIDNDIREFYVHVPASYDGNQSIPAVFMLHGSSGDGLKFYNISGWKEVGEAEGFISVFPSSWEYCVIEDGKSIRTTKWNTFGSFEFCTGEKPRDDEKFMGAIIDDLKKKYNINLKKVYMVGFSNGGSMASSCMINLSDRFAAICANSGSLQPDSIFPVKRLLPVMLEVGNSESGILAANNNMPLEMNMNKILQVLPLKAILNTYIKSLKVNPIYQTDGNPNQFLTATFKGNENVPFLFRVVKNQEHIYPNGSNHPFKAAEEQWKWMKEFSLP